MVVVAAVKILFDAIYEKWGVTDSVGWSIAYNFIDYTFLAASLMLIVFIIDSGVKLPKWITNYKTIFKPVILIASVSYWIIACIELTYIGQTWNVYHGNGGGGFFAAQAYTIVCALCFYRWLYYVKKKNEVFKWM